jgi:hypothetical protein
VFENKVLWRIFEPKRGEMIGDWKKLRNEELHNLCSSPNIIRMIKEDEMGRTNGTHRREGKMYTGFWWENQKDVDHHEDIYKHRWEKILKCILEK